MGLRLQSTAPNYAADATIDVMSNQQAITLQFCFWRVGYFLGWCVCVNFNILTSERRTFGPTVAFVLLSSIVHRTRNPRKKIILNEVYL